MLFILPIIRAQCTNTITSPTKYLQLITTNTKYSTRVKKLPQINRQFRCSNTISCYTIPPRPVPLLIKTEFSFPYSQDFAGDSRLIHTNPVNNLMHFNIILQFISSGTSLIEFTIKFCAALVISLTCTTFPTLTTLLDLNSTKQFSEEYKLYP